MRRARRGNGVVVGACWLPCGGAAAVLMVAVLVASVFILPARDVTSQSSPEVRPEVLQALRLLLSEDPREEDRGERAIRRMGAGIVPDLRAWIHRARLQIDRVAALVAALEGQDVRAPSTERMTAGEFLGQKVVECRGLMRNGDHQGGLALAEAILLLDRQNPYSWELRRLSRRAKERLVVKQVLEPSVEASKLVHEIGEKTAMVFRITNHDSRVARIRLDRGALGELSVTVTWQFLDGSVRREQNRVVVQVAEDVEQILVGPGLTWEYPLAIAGLEELPPNGVVARIQVAGRFRPRRWTVEGGDTGNIGLPMSGAELWIVPKGETDLCDRPIEKLTAGLLFKRIETIFVGGQLAVWAAEEDAYYNEALVKTLIEGLEDLDPSGQKLVDRFLAQATGRNHGGDPAAWKEWWRKTLAGQSSPRARPEDPNTPDR